MTYEQANSVKELAPKVNEMMKKLEVECPECKGTGHTFINKPCSKCVSSGFVKYSWMPQVGEFYLLVNKVFLVNQTPYKLNIHTDAIPILEWEEIERVLEKAGYTLWESYSSRGRYTAGIDDKEATFGDSRQEAVYKAMIALRKELKK